MARWQHTEFGAAELLYLFGCIRRDLKTDVFVEAETKAYDWVMKHGVRERFWPINVCHSMSGGYPIWRHAVTALYFSRYLLECAPPDRRDLKLAEAVARWTEDTSIDWHRATEGPQSGQITPHVNRIDRCNNEPLASNMLAAIVFEELGQATKNRLWSVKAEALAIAVLQANTRKPVIRTQVWSRKSTSTIRGNSTMPSSGIGTFPVVGLPNCCESMRR